MIVAVDNTFLCLLLNPDASPAANPQTGVPAKHWKERIESLIKRHSQSGDTILIPTPCLAELLAAVPDITKAIEQIESSSCMVAAPFDARCAIELGIENQKAIKSGDKKSGSNEGWQKVKFDRQIAIIAKVGGARTFYTDDMNQTKFAKELGMEVQHSWGLELSLEYAQISLLDNEDE